MKNRKMRSKQMPKMMMNSDKLEERDSCRSDCDSRMQDMDDEM